MLQLFLQGLRLAPTYDWTGTGLATSTALLTKTATHLVFSSLALSTLALLLAVDLTGGCQLCGSHEHVGIACLGIGYDRIDEEDNQKVSNHTKASIGPELVVGLRLRF